MKTVTAPSALSDLDLAAQAFASGNPVLAYGLAIALVALAAAWLADLV